ncbi:hypothetical protein NADFUDRAFT_46968 [Nadsonia fulvescens var. elongata DSM 6958]|uniref:HIG1 domain-containing protein n=1 Tax=Nadsonia fulvescens var. elongata DSM 6958 TaxID=857566 RepID=A0A1E3PIK4_9ASCO|nr:hypothetical protein NADFUDRAFT_46968 [Nadsonia fulvescens var. elongata DSM 6958]
MSNAPLSTSSPSSTPNKIANLGGYEKKILIGSAKGIALGFLSSYFIAKQLKRRWVGWNDLNVTAKMLFIISPPTALGIAGCEQAYLDFEHDIYANALNTPAAIARQKRIDSLSTKDKLFYYGHRHKYKIIVGIWATSLYGSWHLINRDKLMTHPQKIVQARMYAQALSVALLVGTLAVTYSNSGSPILKAIEDEEDRGEKNISDDWRQAVADEEKRLEKTKGSTVS